MSVLILNADDVRRLLPMAACIEAVAEALGGLARGDAVQPLRSVLRLSNRRGFLGVMPAQLASPPVAGIKVITVVPDNHARGLDSHQGTVQLFEIETGKPLAILDASSITAVRTAAASALATRLMSHRDAGDLALLGTGVQALSHLEAMAAVRTLRRIRAWSRDEANVRRFAATAARRFGLIVEPMPSARAAVEGADLVCTVTAAREPIVEGAWLAAGAHVNAVGGCTPDSRELDAAAIARAYVITDRLESARNEAGNLIQARAEGAIGDNHLRGELGDVLLRRLPGRTDDQQLTLFESLGIGVEDLAAGYHVYRQARRTGAGLAVDLT